jgi:hypothetical protein
MAKQRLLGRDHQVGIGRLVEVPAIAIAFGFDDADLLEILQAAHPEVRIGIQLRDHRQVAIRILGRITNVRVLRNLEFVQ